MRYLMIKESVFYLQKEITDSTNEYKESYKQVIKQRERRRIPFFHQSPQLMYRERLVEYIKRICVERKLTHCCLHLAIYLMDVFMDNHSILPDRVHLVANICLLLAAKFEENTTKVPKILELNHILENKYPLQDYKDYEIIVLRFFDWYIMYPTAAHYTHYYLQAAISWEDITVNNSFRSIFFNMHEAIISYLDHIINNVHYMQCYQPSKLAAAIISASRLDLGLSIWTEELEDLTDYTLNDFYEPLKRLMAKANFMKCKECAVTKIG